MSAVRLVDFGLSEEFGYLPHYDPAQSLSPGNEEWDEFALDIPKLLMGSDFRKRVKELKPFDISALHGEARCATRDDDPQLYRPVLSMER